MPFAFKVCLIASFINSFVGISVNASVLADACKRLRCCLSENIFPSYTRKPSQTASPPCTELSKTDTFASLRGYNLSFTKICMFSFFGLYCCCISKLLLSVDIIDRNIFGFRCIKVQDILVKVCYLFFAFQNPLICEHSHTSILPKRRLLFSVPFSNAASLYKTEFPR